MHGREGPGEDELLEPRPEPETPEESAEHRREAADRFWDEQLPPHYEAR